MNKTTKGGFCGQYVLLAGASRGIGFELAKLLLADGAHVIVVGRNAERAALAETALKEVGTEDQVRVLLGDLCQETQLNQVKTQVEECIHGKLHHLAIFLGSGKTPPGFDFPLDHWRDVFEINTFAPIGVVQAFVPIMMHGEGNPSITLTSAIAGLERVRAPMTYSIAKSALIAYAKHLAEALIEYNIRVHNISPGNVFFKGGRWEELLDERPEEIAEFLKQSVGMKRLGTAGELAWVYYSVMSPRNSFMTGHNLVVDGLQIKRI